MGENSDKPDAAGSRTRQQQPDFASGSRQQAGAGDGAERGDTESQQEQAADSSDAGLAGGTANFGKIDGPHQNRRVKP